MIHTVEVVDVAASNTWMSDANIWPDFQYENVLSANFYVNIN